MHVPTVQRRSDLGAVRAQRRRKHVCGAVVVQRGGALWVEGKRGGRVLVVGVEAQPLAAVEHGVRESVGAAGVRRAGGAVVVAGNRVQLIQRDGGDGGAVVGQGVAGVAGKVRERVRSPHRALVHLRAILLTAVILQPRKRQGRLHVFSGEKGGLPTCETHLESTVTEDCYDAQQYHPGENSSGNDDSSR